MNSFTTAGFVLMFLSLLLPAPWALAPWLTGIALVGYGRGIATGERDMRRLWRGGE